MVSDGYAFLVEMLFEASRRGCRIGEVPIIFVERAQGHSKLSTPVLLESLVIPWRLVLRRSPLSMSEVVVMVTTSYPRFPGDSVGTFMEPIAASVAARGHEVHVVAPWHPLVDARAGRARRPFSFLRIRAGSGAERFRLRGGAARGRERCAARHTWRRRWRSRPDGSRRWRVARRYRATVMHGHWVIPGGFTALGGGASAAAGRQPSRIRRLRRRDVRARAASGAAGFRSRRRRHSLQRRSGAAGDRALAPIPRSIEVVPYGVDIGPVPPAAGATRGAAGATGRGGGHAARASRRAGWCRKKGFEHLIDAWARAAR